ncbi:MAG: hypothetical protein RPT94_13850, partial [Candidatus Sedimenticola sp. (ex Thyasira tokunagai)]
MSSLIAFRLIEEKAHLTGLPLGPLLTRNDRRQKTAQSGQGHLDGISHEQTFCLLTIQALKHLLRPVILVSS